MMSRRLSLGCVVAAAKRLRDPLGARRAGRAEAAPREETAYSQPGFVSAADRREMPRQNRDAGEDSAIAQQLGAVDAGDLVCILPRDRLAGLFVRRAGKHGLRAFAAAADAAFEKHLVGCFPVVFDDPFLEWQRGLGFAST